MNTNSTIGNLKKAGFRITAVRRQLIELLEDITNPITVSEILHKIKANKTTIYREISTLLSNNYLIEIDLSDGVKRYELSGRDHHHHLVCVKCKAVSDVKVVDDLTKTEEAITSEKNFKIIRHSLEFFGICGRCNL
jgi:Fe2+ or Zn2+ uptake regulation protein